MKTYDLLNLPSCANIQHHWAANTLAYRIAEFALCSKTSTPWDVGMLRRMNLVRKVIATEGNGFFASDVFGKCDGLGGWMNGLDIAHIIESTGVTRDEFIDFGDGYGKMVQVKEWKLAHHPTALWEAYNEVKQFIVDQL